ncbi:MAG: hypothetical protein JW795_16755 [Chitinivibrionales bacterium]|nr:hypothetical protein [Chitinivibrionales bacterium]
MSERTKSFLVILLLGTAVTALIVWAEQYTKPMRDSYKEKQMQIALLACLRIDYSDENRKQVFNSVVHTTTVKGTMVYRGPDSSAAIAFRRTGAAGTISGVVGFEPDGKTVSHAVVLDTAVWIGMQAAPGVKARNLRDRQRWIEEARSYYATITGRTQR